MYYDIVNRNKDESEVTIIVLQSNIFIIICT